MKIIFFLQKRLFVHNANPNSMPFKKKTFYLFKMCMYAIGCFKMEHTSIYEWQSWYPTPIPIFFKSAYYCQKLYELNFL